MYLKSAKSSPRSPSPSLGGEALISKKQALQRLCPETFDFNPSGHRSLATPLLTHCGHSQSSIAAPCPACIPAQPMWKPRSQPSHTIKCPLTSGRPQSGHAEPQVSPGTTAAALAEGIGLLWKVWTTANASGDRASDEEVEGISLRSMPRMEQVRSGSSSSVEWASSISRVETARPSPEALPFELETCLASTTVSNLLEQ